MAKSAKQVTGKAPTDDTQDKKKSKKKSSSMCMGMMFRSAIKRISREVSPDNNIMLTNNSIQVLCAIAYDFVDTVAELGGEMARKVGKQTVGSDDIISAFEIILKGELRKLAIREVHTALAKSQVKPRGK
ncbi:histone H2B-like protein [Ordospora colligata]|uniref:Histone H2B-like protein n=1 Tax=Ordospora colligata OC4 TaxID=1354746 RepID=A0A0B2UIC5_9MICR|nr:histone H2B-like protein [Ordospora colligata OC4]KHN69113.1 histone H2B-like protein [Ordospora colligata OC4]TBU14568.1 histone H2B-like protein [Ordospora colligata]TBU14762.1 histone H2B-like protein [Ordospora colligata]TBU18196.1 histone H2B-like protein [Ordospora colligata]